jgi:hypothetical protein
MLREWTSSGYITRDYYAVGQVAAAPVSEPVVESLVEEHPILDFIEKVEKCVEAVTPFVESVAIQSVRSFLRLVDVAEQFIEDAEKRLIEPKVPEEAKEEA